MKWTNEATGRTIEIYNEDCMPALAKMQENEFELAIVDPPYGIGADKVQNDQSDSGRISNGGTWKKYKQTKWDNNIPDSNFFSQLIKKTKNQIIWGGNYFYDLNLNGIIIWNKGKNLNMKEGELAKSSFNTFKIYYCSRTDAYINDCDMKIHPTQKPVALYKWLLKNYAKPNDKILDTHLGSGSIAIACNDMGFDLTGYELDKEYFDGAVKRLANHKAQGDLFSGQNMEEYKQEELNL